MGRSSHERTWRRGLARAAMPTQVASGELTEEIAKLKAQDGKPIIAHGGASFARSLLRS